jgi:hypothetical protein
MVIRFYDKFICYRKRNIPMRYLSTCSGAKAIQEVHSQKTWIKNHFMQHLERF